MTTKVLPKPEDQLKRFLYTSNGEPRFVTGNADFHKAYLPHNLQWILTLLTSKNPEILLNIIEKVNSENLLSRRETMFVALAVASKQTVPEELKHKIFVTLSNITRTFQDLCLFLKYYTVPNKKFSSAIKKVIASYYAKKDPDALLDEIIKFNSFHSWKHKDLIKLSHFRSTSLEQTLITRYILFGLKTANEVAEENASLQVIIEKLKKNQELKRCECVTRIAELIKELKCNEIKQVPSFYHNNQVVWEALLSELKIQDILQNLIKFYKLGFLKSANPFQNLIVNILTNAEKVQLSKIHPVEVLIGIRNFEMGGKPTDPQFMAYLKTVEHAAKDNPELKNLELSREPPKCPAVINALNKTLALSFRNMHSTGRRILIAIDVNQKMQLPCLTVKNLSGMDAAMVLTLSFLRVEKDVTVVVFNDNNRVTPVNLDKNIALNTALAKIKNYKCTHVLPSAAIEWASTKRKPIDVFINFLQCHGWRQSLSKEVRDKEKPIESLMNYRKKMALPNTKLISFSLSTPHHSIADGSPNVLDICGFNKEVPKVIEAFNRGMFS